MHFQAHTVTGAAPGPRLLITAGIHGDEFEGVEAVRMLLSRVDYDDLRGELILVPVANESAYEMRKRAGSDGLDLARTFPGSPDGSISERVAHDLTKLIDTADAYIDLHSGGRLLWVSPLVGYMLVDDEAVLERQREMAKAFGLPIVWGTSAGLDGRSLSAARDANVPAIYAEYLGGGAYSTEGVNAYVQGCRNVMATLGMIGRDADGPAPLLVVEDARPGSGHLQVHHCAPNGGKMRFEVTLDEDVQEGQLLGELRPTGGGEPVAVRAEASGRIICLHAGKRVAIGDCLAVVLEYNPKQVTA
jgi:predicted deacylase